MSIETSVIVSTYKRSPNVIKRALNSICNQTYQDCEIILVDDNPACEKLSSEDVSKLKEDIRLPFTYITYEGNRGACFARNTGAQKAVGKYLAFLDDDDEWTEDKLKDQIDGFKDPGVVMVTCDLYLVQNNENGNCSCEEVSYSGNIYISRNDLFELGNIIGGASFPLIKKEPFDKTGGLRMDLRPVRILTSGYVF